MDELTQLAIPAPLVEELWAATKRAFPREACGLITGSRSSPWIRVNTLTVVRNRAKGINGFAIAQSDIEKLKESSGSTIVALFHSHRQSAYPSPSDINAMKKQSTVWIIAASGNPPSRQAFHLRAFHWNQAQLVELYIKEICNDSITDVRAFTGND